MSATVSPAPGFVVHASEFERVLGPAPRIVEVIATDAHEGPVYAADEDALYFTTVPRRSGHLDLTLPLVSVRRLALDGRRFPLEQNRLTTLRAPANAANGMTMDREGRLVMCEQGSFLEPAAITRLDRRTGAIETLVDGAGGLPLNSPNDVAVTRDGAIWFTDPSYGFLQGFRPEPAAADLVYRYDRAARRLDVVAAGFDKPNGLVFAPAEDVLYVSDNGAPQQLLAFDVDGGRLRNRRVFAPGTPGHPDGARRRRRRARLRIRDQRDPRVLTHGRADRRDRASGSRQLHVRRTRRRHPLRHRGRRHLGVLLQDSR
jgi:gluconolactonase